LATFFRGEALAFAGDLAAFLAGAFLAGDLAGAFFAGDFAAAFLAGAGSSSSES